MNRLLPWQSARLNPGSVDRIVCQTDAAISPPDYDAEAGTERRAAAFEAIR